MKFRCTRCGCENTIGTPPKEDRVLLVCGNCGLVSETDEQRIDNCIKKGDNWLECISWTGPERKLPLGYVQIVGDEKMYASSENGDLLTRTEYIAHYGLDPEIAIKNMGMDTKPLRVGTWKRPTIPPVNLGKFNPK